ncbi:hypothetical protein JCGZ_22572 [Jatropha curcas]|uniref:Uncharacterized protein n=1 Tax=Jatropha curcas TaxID=180498 RepID=A0A067JMB7_JATCU|nr:uncharacterized protein LOC105646129 [Jatropha curcas]KDP25037.1 hypothetical protein JCGZ_22572 [Jatropha curcas]
MGTVISKAANEIGGVLGNAFASPFKTILEASCEEICAGPWDVICFIEHLCVSNLLKLLMILGLCYITLMFLYLLFQLGICQCIGRSLCNMCWAACETYCLSLQYICCFLWHKLKNTKRVRRRRFRDIERGGYTSTSENGYSHNYDHHHHHHLSVGTKRKSTREGRKFPMQRSRRRHHVRLTTREVSLHVKGGSRRPRNSRRLELVRLKNHPRNVATFKRRRIR